MKEMVATLKKPRRVMMLVKAGPAVDAFIEQLVSGQFLSQIHRIKLPHKPLATIKDPQLLASVCLRRQWNQRHVLVSG